MSRQASYSPVAWDGCIINDYHEHNQCSNHVKEVFYVSIQLSTEEQQNITGGSYMENRPAEMIREMKEIKVRCKVSYMDIMEEMAERDETTMASLSTLRRIFRDGSEYKASSFNFEEILVPVYVAVKALDKEPKEKTEFDKELDGYKAVIRVQNEELDRLLELKEHLDERVDFLVEQIRLKDELIAKLTNKFL